MGEMNLLDDIRTDLVDDSANLSNTLRKAKILAGTMGLPEFREWVDSELSGYPNKDKVPSYRSFPGLNLGTFLGPFEKVENMVLPTYNLPDQVKDFAERLVFVQGVGALEGMLAQKSESFEVSWPQEYVFLSREAMKMVGGMVLVAAHQPVSPYLIVGVLDNVKNKLLDFILGLQKSNVTSESLDKGTVEPEVVRNLFQVTINGNHNIVASGENVHQKVNAVQKGEIDSLLNHFRELNVDSDALRELEDAVSSEPSVSKGKFGPKVHAWIGGMISKAASGTWKVDLSTAPSVLMDAVNGFYGS